MKYLVITFERGGKFYARLFQDKTPKTTEAIIDALPLEVEFMQSRFGGQGIFFRTNFGDIPPENQGIDMETGMLSLFMGSENFPAKVVHIWYGDRIATRHTENKFACIEKNRGDFSKLRTVGERVWTKGAEKARIELFEDSG